MGRPDLVLHGQKESRGTPKGSIPLFQCMRTQLTIVGGGLGGLVTAISAREAGLEVTLYEARKELGGRARTTDGSELHPGERVRVESLDGLVLTVAPEA